MTTKTKTVYPPKGLTMSKALAALQQLKRVLNARGVPARINNNLTLTMPANVAIPKATSVATTKPLAVDGSGSKPSSSILPAQPVPLMPAAINIPVKTAAGFTGTLTTPGEWKYNPIKSSAWLIPNVTTPTITVQCAGGSGQVHLWVAMPDGSVARKPKIPFMAWIDTGLADAVGANGCTVQVDTPMQGTYIAWVELEVPTENDTINHWRNA